MWVCKKCGANNSGNAKYCPNCGQPKVPEKKAVKLELNIQTVILCAGILLAVAAILLFYFREEKTEPPTVTTEIVTQIVYVTPEPTASLTPSPTPSASQQTSKPSGISTPAPTSQSTPAPTIQPTPAPTIQPTPAPTEEPRPSAEDLKPFGTTITYPSKNAYLDHYETMYVKAPKGHSIYVFWKANGAEEYRRSFYLYEKDEVTVIARQNGFACVIFTDTNGTQRAGWVNKNYLVDVY